MLAAAMRLRRSADIERVYAIGRQAFHPLVRIIAAPSTAPQSRVAVVTSLKVSKKAVERNLVRRRLRVIMRPWLPRLRAPLDCMVIAQAKAKTATFQELASAVEQNLKKLRII